MRNEIGLFRYALLLLYNFVCEVISGILRICSTNMNIGMRPFSGMKVAISLQVVSYVYAVLGTS